LTTLVCTSGNPKAQGMIQETTPTSSLSTM